MKTLITMLLTLGVAFSVQAEEEGPALETLQQKGSYAMGYELGSQLSSQGVSFDEDLYLQGIRDGLTGAEALLDSTEMRASTLAYQKEMQKAVISKREEDARKNQAAGAEFIKKHAEEEGVQTTENGLQYQVMVEGTGETSPGPDDTVTVHYTGRLIDGTVFDSSVERGEPATFPLQRVIPGWSQALQLMTAGAKWRVIIPADLAYGERGSPPRIPPNAVLDFDIELIAIK
jgi:FKBP-type peptidyl-prolyl cis-trans isomerase FklB